MAGRLAPRQRRSMVAVAVLVAAMVPVLAGPAGAGAPVCNTTPIVFTPPPVPTPAVQRFLPYPSNINIAGLSGAVTDVNVSFLDITYAFPEDIDVLLVAPDGSTNLIVMSDIGGDNAGGGNPITDVDLTFDDEAASVPPRNGQLVSGTYQPLNDVDSGDFSPDTFPSPAPTQSTATALSQFDGVAPNGTWSLYVIDDEPGPNVSGDFGGGWCIDITSGTGPTTTTSPTTSTTTTSTTLPPTTTTSTTLPPTTTTSTTLPPTTTTSTTLPPTTTTSTTLPPTTTTSTTRPTTTTSTTSTTLPPTTTTSTTRPTTTTTSTTLPSTTTTTVVGTTTLTCVFKTPLSGPPFIRCRAHDRDGIRRVNVVDTTTGVMEQSIVLPRNPVTRAVIFEIDPADGNTHRIHVNDLAGDTARFFVGPDGTVTPG